MTDYQIDSDRIENYQPTIFAHRGASLHAPENTLAAFKLAVEQGADAIELDAKLSADGQVVVMHDDSVDRTTNGTGRIKSLTLSELQQLDAGSKFNPSFHKETIPSLAEVFEAVGRKILINVELTNYSSPIDDLPEKVASLVKDFQLEKSVLLSSFNMIALIRARKLLSATPMGLLTFPSLGRMTLDSNLIRFDSLLSLHPDVSDSTSELIHAVHRVGSRLNVYTVNQAEDMRRLFSQGVDGIFTDDPPLAKTILAKFISQEP